MLRLNLKKEPYWIDLPSDVRVHVRPLTTAIMTAAQSTVIKQIKALREEIKQQEESGKTPLAFPDLENEQTRLGVSQSLLVKALAIAAIIEWEGVMQPDSDKLAAINEKSISELMDIWFVGQDFWEKYTTSFTMAEQEGNGSRLAVNGTSAAGLPTAPAVPRKRSRAAKASATQ
jgi:hypothetical protein